MREFVGIVVMMAIFSIIALFLCSTDGLQAISVSAPTGLTLEAASAGVTEWFMSVVAGCAGAAIAWWALGMYFFKAGRGQEGRWIVFWWALLALPVLCSVFALLWEPPIEGSAMVLKALEVGSGILFYWLAAAMFSPPLTKRVPPGSRMLRFLK